MRKRIRICILCIALLLSSLSLAGCGNKSQLKTELETKEITMTLPDVKLTGCRKLAEADEEIYKQQIAACEMYYEAYEITRTSDYMEEYKDQLKDNKIAYYCNLRRQNLDLDISTRLSDNVRNMIKSVEDCENIDAYVKRVQYDTENFYDYYMDYMNTNGGKGAISRILMSFFEKNNILAFRFMNEHKNEFIRGAVKTIEENSKETVNLNMYISQNNRIIKALNTIYGGVPDKYAQTITTANITLVRRMLETDSSLAEKDINSLMQQLGEPTPTPEPTPEPTEAPTPTIEPSPAPIAIPGTTAAIVPKPTTAPAQEKPAMATQPAAATETPEESEQRTPKVYSFGE